MLSKASETGGGVWCERVARHPFCLKQAVGIRGHAGSRLASGMGQPTADRASVLQPSPPAKPLLELHPFSHAASRAADLEAQYRKVSQELAEYKAESTQIKNQDLTIRKVREQRGGVGGSIHATNTHHAAPKGLGTRRPATVAVTWPSFTQRHTMPSPECMGT